jgi:CBS domain-containing protein
MNAGEVMSRNPIAVPAEAGLTEALRLVFDHRISGLPVVDGKAGLVGILTEGDLLRRALGVGDQLGDDLLDRGDGPRQVPARRSDVKRNCPPG